MKKTIVIIILGLLWCNVGFAEWKIIYFHKGYGGTEHYIDKSKIKRDGSTVYYWHLVNFLKKDVDRDYMSTFTYSVVDCKILRGKSLEFVGKSLQMGEGETVFTYTPPDEWEYPSPGSVREHTYSEVCN